MMPGGMYMKQMFKDFGLSLAMGVLVPYLFLSFGVTLLNRYREQTIPAASARTEAVQQATVALPVQRRDKDTVTEMNMDDYLVGVVLAEMPASFETEALKAQSCVARTYAWKAYTTGGKHKDGSVCGVSSCCQGYRSEEDYLAAGGMAEAVDRVRSAVCATSGCVLTYGGELIEATYFSCSGGRTEDAVAVWGTAFPYLQAVDSPGEEQASCFSDNQYFSAEAFARALGISTEGEPDSWLGMTLYTEGGGVHTITIGGKEFLGTEVRNLLGLRSTAFSITADSSGFLVTTKGYGHRVGMSQYGADAMAKNGSTWEEILKHYYSGAEVTRLS